MDLGYRAVFSEDVAGFFLGLPKRRQRKLLDRARELARHPLVRPDYWSKDTDGRDIAHLMVGGFVFTYWIDDPVKLVMITDVDDAE